MNERNQRKNRFNYWKHETYSGAATCIGNWSAQRCRSIPSHNWTPTMPKMKNTKKHRSKTLPSIGNVSSNSITSIRIPLRIRIRIGVEGDANPNKQREEKSTRKIYSLRICLRVLGVEWLDRMDRECERGDQARPPDQKLCWQTCWFVDCLLLMFHSPTIVAANSTNALILTQSSLSAIQYRFDGRIRRETERRISFRWTRIPFFRGISCRMLVCGVWRTCSGRAFSHRSHLCSRYGRCAAYAVHKPIQRLPLLSIYFVWIRFLLLIWWD